VHYLIWRALFWLNFVVNLSYHGTLNSVFVEVIISFIIYRLVFSLYAIKDKLIDYFFKSFRVFIFFLRDRGLFLLFNVLYLKYG
jgi:hypothetical protein